MTITELLDDLGIDYRLNGQSPHVSAGWVGVVCPWCDNGEGKFGLGYNLNTRAASCWKCGVHGLAETLIERTGLPARDICARIREAGLTGPLPLDAGQRIPGGILRKPMGIGTLGPSHLHYLHRTRGFSMEKIEEMEKIWKIGGISIDCDLAPNWSLFIPITLNGHEVSWTTRKITDQTNHRYHSAGPTEEKVPHKTLLFAEDLCRNTVVVVEGPLDAMAIGPGAVATFGTSYSREQAARIGRYPVRVITYDAEEQAQIVARRLCRDLSVFPGQTFNIVLETGKDAAECQQEARELRRRFLE